MTFSRTALLHLLAFITLSMSLTACHLLQIHQPDIQQGNVLSPRLVDQLKPGMTSEEVVSILGDPLLTNAFRPYTLNYVYQLRVQNKPIKTKRLTLEFKNGTLMHYAITTN
jgi:outer membrane protein assembly factor BamE